MGLVGTWWSGQEHPVLSGIDGVLLVVVIGEGKLVVPVDFAIRRPDPRVAVVVERAGAWGTLCAAAGHQSDV